MSEELKVRANFFVLKLSMDGPRFDPFENEKVPVEDRPSTKALRMLMEQVAGEVSSGRIGKPPLSIEVDLEQDGPTAKHVAKVFGPPEGKA